MPASMFCRYVTEQLARAASAAREIPTCSRRSRIETSAACATIVVVDVTDKQTPSSRLREAAKTASTNATSEKGVTKKPGRPTGTTERTIALGRAAHLGMTVVSHPLTDLLIYNGLATSSLGLRPNGKHLEQIEDRGYARKRIVYWIEKAELDVPRPTETEAQANAAEARAARKITNWIVVPPSPGWSPGETFDLRTPDGERQELDPRDDPGGAANKLALQVGYVHTAAVANVWSIAPGVIHHRSADPYFVMCSREEYCDLLESKIADLRRHADHLDGRRALRSWVDNNAAKEILRYHGLDGDRDQATASIAGDGKIGANVCAILTEEDGWRGPRPAHAADAWGHLDFHRSSLEETIRDTVDVFRNPTLEAVERHWDTSSGDGSAIEPGTYEQDQIAYRLRPVDVDRLQPGGDCVGSDPSSYECPCAECVTYRSDVHKLGAAARNRPQPWHPRKPRFRTRDIPCSLHLDLEARDLPKRYVGDPEPSLASSPMLDAVLPMGMTIYPAGPAKSERGGLTLCGACGRTRLVHILPECPRCRELRPGVNVGGVAWAALAFACTTPAQEIELPLAA